MTLLTSSNFIFLWLITNFRRMALRGKEGLNALLSSSAGFDKEYDGPDNDGQYDDGQLDCKPVIDFIPYQLFHHDCMESAFNDPEWMAMAWSLSARTACIDPERIRA